MAPKIKCKIILDSEEHQDWVIPGELSNTNVRPLMFENYECAGTFQINNLIVEKCSDTKCTKSKEKSTKLFEMNKGGKSSVKTTEGYCNFHTHPYPCYQGEGTLWGWPSGEDMRECVRFVLKGNLFHSIYALEGIYTIQVNPNFIYLMSNDDVLSGIIPGFDPITIRGIICSLIESYFKCTHGHRTVEYSKKHGNPKKTVIHKDDHYHSKDTGVCMPSDWVDFANKFNLGNMLAEKNNKCSDLLPCNGFPEFDKRFNGAIPLSEFIEAFGFDSYGMHKDSSIVDTKKLDKHITDTNIAKLIKFFNDFDTDLTYGDEKWAKGQWFRCQLFPNSYNLDGRIYTFNELSREFKAINMFNTWDKFNPEKCKDGTCIIFPDVSIRFKPFGDDSECSIIHGTEIKEWINEHYLNKYPLKTQKYGSRKTVRKTSRKRTKKTSSRK